VISFTEKPNQEKARGFLAAGRYLWNSGMFVWRADTILSEMQKSIPQVYSCFEPLLNQSVDQSEIVAEAFTKSPSISVDYGVMEKAQQVLVTPGDFGWSDVGDWQAAYDVSPKDDHGNALTGPVSALDAKNCFAHAKEREIVLLGVENLVVVDSGDTVLVCDRSQTQRVKEAANLVDQTDLAHKQ
jgi:mannose-1-phosphate guanylyltransferase